MHNIPQQHNYVISLLTAKERRNHIIQEFGKQNIPFEFFDAITPDLIEEKAKEFSIDISNSPLTKGEMGCALSHIALWHFAKENKLDYICIFEDDIYLGENAKEFLTNSYVNHDIDVIKIEKHSSKIIYAANPEAHFCNRNLHKLKSKHTGTAGYILTAKGIKYLLEKTKVYHLSIPVDVLMFEKFLKKSDYKVLQLIPAICIQDDVLNKKINFKSTLSDDRNNKKSKKNLSKLYREIIRPFIKLRKKLFSKYIEFK